MADSCVRLSAPTEPWWDLTTALLARVRNRRRRHNNKMNLEKEKISRVSQHDMGRRARPTSLLPPVDGGTFLLTLPFTERAQRTVLKNNSLWASKTGNSRHTESVTCDRGRSGVFGQLVPRASAPSGPFCGTAPFRHLNHPVIYLEFSAFGRCWLEIDPRPKLEGSRAT
jgi:hypothetical protein